MRSLGATRDLEFHRMALLAAENTINWLLI